MKHRILVLGAGYAGARIAGTLARRLSPQDVEITVVNAGPRFVQRMRLHQLAAGQEVASRPLADVFAGTGVRLRVGRVTALDPDRRTVTVTAATPDAGDGAHGDGIDGTGGELAYDTLVYTLGSRVADHGVPGVAEHAYDVAEGPSARRLRERLDRLEKADGGGTVLVVGEGLTGIEAATEIAESRPGLSVALAARGEPGAWMSPRARRHLRRSLDRLGVTVHEGTVVEAVEPGRAIAAGGAALPADVTVWAAGFAVLPLAAEAGLEVAGDGRIVVDRTMRSVSHPDVYAAGDGAYTIGADGEPLPMSCFCAGITSSRLVEAVVAHLTGRTAPTSALSRLGNCVSLGRRDAIVQWVRRDGKARSWSLRGRTATRYKAAVLSGAHWAAAHPTFGLPRRRRRLTASAPVRTAPREAAV